MIRGSCFCYLDYKWVVVAFWELCRSQFTCSFWQDLSWVLSVFRTSGVILQLRCLSSMETRLSSPFPLPGCVPWLMPKQIPAAGSVHIFFICSFTACKLCEAGGFSATWCQTQFQKAYTCCSFQFQLLLVYACHRKTSWKRIWDFIGNIVDVFLIYIAQMCQCNSIVTTTSAVTTLYG